MEKTNFNLFCWTIMSFFWGGLLTTSAQCLPSLGSASGFVIYTASGAISNLTTSTITGNIGTNAGAITGFESSTITGDFSIANSVTQTAAVDLASAYAAYQNLTPTITAHAPSFGSGEILIPGVYSIGAAGSIAGVLTLDAQNDPNAKFILKFVGAFTSGAGSAIVLTNGASANNVYWIVEGAFSLAAQTSFSGTVIAVGAISIGVGNHLNCKLLSTAGAISTYGTLLTNDGIDNSYNKYYDDADADGYGNPDVSSCYLIAGYILNHTDCNDANAAIHPNAIEIYGNGIDDNCNGIIDTDAVSCSFTTTWDGTSWLPFLPVANQHAVIAGDYSQSNNLFSCSLDIINNAIVNVPSGTNFTISGTLNVAATATLTFNNNTNLIQTDASAVNTGNIIVNRKSAKIIRLDHTLWSSPVTGQNLRLFSPLTVPYRFYTYDTTNNQYDATTITDATVFTPAQGFAIRAPNNYQASPAVEWNGTFTGVPNNGTKTFPLVYASGAANINLVGNPYPSAIDAATFYSVNSGVINGTLYFYQHTLKMDANGLFPTGTNYGTWTSSGGSTAAALGTATPSIAVNPSGIIEVGQGFMVKSTNTGDLTFNNSMRVASATHQFMKSSSTVTTLEKHRMWLNLESATGSDLNQILVGYVTGATEGVDDGYDGLAFGGTGSSLYSPIDARNYVIQCRSLPFNNTDEVPLGFNCTEAGTYSIKLSSVDGLFEGNQDVFIRDNLNGTDTNIKIAPFTFTSDIGTFDNRFKIVYTQALGVPSSTFNENSVIVYKNSDWFHVSTKGISMKDILVYDISGRLIYKLNDLNDTTAVLKGLTTTKQVLFLKITSTENQSVTIKVLN